MIDPSISTFLITLLNIGILFFVLRAVLFKPVTRFMEARSKKIQDAFDQAEATKAAAQALLGQYEARLQHVQEEAADIRQAAQETARKQAEQILAEGTERAAQALDQGRKQLEAERQAALAVFRAEAAALVLSAASRILQRELSGEDTRRFAGLLLQELGTEPHV
ncbi:MAG: ATP synthase F0 subunit B [Treponema sp.]|jgi:F-type H+-transporting ATPase subunit b|nr:ATP synthase F0 subunit B [Treponema sp.]